MKTTIIFILIAIIILMGYFLLSKPAVAPAPEPAPTSEPTSAVVEDTTQPAETSAETENITISTDSLGEGQQKMLETFGVEGDILITPEMIACAEEKIDRARLDEIIGGATPSFMEGVALASCY